MKSDLSTASAAGDTPQPPRLLDQLRARVRYCHYSLSTERSYLYWVRQFIRFHGLRHPREMGGAEVAAFLTHLAAANKASASTHRQALSALLFLYRQVLGTELPWMDEIGRPSVPARVPVVLSRAETERLLARMSGTEALIARLLYGTGMRKMECLRLRVKDLDFDRELIVVRQGKGKKDRITMLPAALQARRTICRPRRQPGPQRPRRGKRDSRCLLIPSPEASPPGGRYLP